MYLIGTKETIKDQEYYKKNLKRNIEFELSKLMLERERGDRSKRVFFYEDSNLVEEEKTL